MTTFSRRAVIRSAATGAVLVGAAALHACTPAGPGDGTEGPGDDGGTSGGPSEDNPFGVVPGTPLRVVAHEGGYGTEYAAAQLELYNHRWGPGASLTTTAKITATLQPELADDPPEVVDNSGADALPVARVVAENRLADLGELLDAPTVDDPDVRIGDVLLPGVAAGGTLDGVLRQLDYAFSVWGLWYSRSLFEEKGWEPATTMDEFLDLCEAIRADGAMAPFIHGGVEAQTMARVICQQAVKHGGTEVLLKMDNLEPDAWTNPSAVAAARAWETVAKSGHIAETAAQQDHRAAQQDWLRGRAAMVPGGSCLAHEVAGAVPDGFDMVMQPMPSLTAEDELPFTALGSGPGLSYVVPENAANRAGALEYLRIMLSDAGAAAFTAHTGSVCAVQGARTTLEHGSGAQQSVAAAAEAAGEHIFEVRFTQWYASLRTALRDATSNLLSRRMTADQFSASMQVAVDTVAQDSRIKKFRRD